MAEVVPIKAGTAFDPKTPCQEAITFLEGYLEEARRGEIIGIAISVVRPIGSCTTDWCPGTAEQHSMLAGAAVLAHKIVVAVAENY